MSTLILTRDEIAGILPSVCINAGRKQTVVLIGPPGTGKTTMVFDMANDTTALQRYNSLTGLELESIPVYVTPCHPDATAPEVFGQYLPLDGNWTFIPGSMLRAWGYNWHNHGPQGPGQLNEYTDPKTGYDFVCNTPPPGIHLLDDIHLMGPGGQAAMYKAMDNGKGGNFLDPWGKTVWPHPAATVFGTMNGEIDSLDPAVVDRSAVKIPVMEPSEAMLDALGNEMLRELCHADYNDNPEPTATYREWLSISQLKPVVGLAKAVYMALGKDDRTKKLIEALAKIEGTGMFPGAGREARDAFNQIVKNTPVKV